MTLYIVQKSGNQNPKLCDFGDIQAGDMVFAGGVSIIVGESPDAWSPTLTDADGKVWTDSQLDHQEVLTSVEQVARRLAAAQSAEEVVLMTDGTVTRRIDLDAAPVADKDNGSFGVLLETGKWTWIDVSGGELVDVGLVEISSESYLAPIWWIKI